ncbi:MAG: hypothetical protein V3U75_13170 [Methylococcaceae bacterium]
MNNTSIPQEPKLTIYRVQRVSEAPVREIRPLKHFLEQEDAEKYLKEIQPDIEKLPFYRKLEVEEVRVY